ncbi:HBL/NHE enterotoxin family protein [Streptomyces lushanensis]|uniref:HBL/NHE enterotoxin family protein n=1 Tax=Streptomyces lushanensis TaxID=1434255 RepID=UPI0008360CAC|nr:HBL/NHE enterotoxin family protein [Streptomyces lushanensis]
MTQPTTEAVSQALVATHSPAIAVQSLTTCLGLIPPLRFDVLEDRAAEELKQLEAGVREKAVRALKAVDDHAELVEDFAGHWDSSLLPSFLDTAADVDGHAKQVETFGSSLRKKIADLGPQPTREQQKDVLESVQSGLGALRDTLTHRTARAAQLAKDLPAGAGRAKKAGDAFAKDRDAVDQAVTGKGGVIDAINQRVAALGKELADDAAKIAQGQFGKVPGIGLMVVGAVVVLAGQPSAGLGVFTTGIGLLTQEGLTLGGVDLSREKKELAGLQQDLSILQASITRFGTTQDAVTRLGENISHSSDAGPALHQVWLDHDQHLSETVALITKALADPGSDLAGVVRDTDRFLAASMHTWAEGRKTATTVTSGLAGIEKNIDKSLLDQPHLAA